MTQPDNSTDLNALSDTLQAAVEEPRSPVGDFACRSGVAKIISNDGDGFYTVTEQRRDLGADQWLDASENLGYVEQTAFDFAANATGQVDQLVQFRQQRGLGGQIELLIGVGDNDGLLLVSDDDTTRGYLGDKLVGDDGTGDNVKVSLVEQNDGGDETLKIQILKADMPAADVEAVCHRICIPDGSSSGTYEFSTADWRGRLLMCWLQAIFNDTPEDVQWGGGSTTGITRFFGSTWSGSDTVLVSASGDNPGVKIEGDTGKLYWVWDANSTGNDLHAVFLIQAGETKNSADHTVTV